MSIEQSNAINSADISPETLMGNFKGPGLVKIIMLAVVFHVVVIAGTSLPYLKHSLLGGNDAELSKEKRMEKAMTEATEALKKIASANGLNPQDITDNLVPVGARAAKPVDTTAPAGKMPGKEAAPMAEVKSNAPATSASANAPAVSGVETPAKPESKIEADVKKTEVGPKVPGVGAKDDIF